jgi:hypothetical protein
MPPKLKPNNESRPPQVSRRTRSHTRADRAEDASAGACHVAEGRLTKVKGKEKKNEVGAKRKADEMKFDEQDASDATGDASSSKKTGKRARKKESEHRAYINPFIPEPSLTVAEHEAHSQALSQAQRVVPSSDPDPSTDGHSLFSQSLASMSNKDTLPTPSKASSSALKPRSHTPARPILVLAPLPPPKSKTISDKARHSVATSARRPFLVPSSPHASSPALPEPSHFSTPFSSSSTQAPSKPFMQTQSTLQAKSVPSQKTSKVVTDKISTLETRVARLEGELQDVRGSLVDTKKSQQKTTEENNKLTKWNETLSDEIGELKEEFEGQGKMLESIQKILDGLKVDGGNLDKAVVKIEASTRNNAFNVSDSLHVVASTMTHYFSL